MEWVLQPGSRGRPPRMNRRQLEQLALQLGVVVPRGMTDTKLRLLLLDGIRTAPVLTTAVLSGILSRVPGVSSVDVLQMIPGGTVGVLISPRWWTYLWPGRRARVRADVAAAIRPLLNPGAAVEITIL